MKILFYSDNFYPEISGISDSILDLGRELTRRGHSVAYVAPKYSESDYRAAGRNPNDSDFFKEFKVCRVPSLRYPNSPSAQARIVIPFCSSLNFARDFKPDVIHTQSPFGTGLEALFVSRLLNVPIVGTNHTIIGEYLKIYGPKFLERPSNAYLYWYYRRMEFVSVPSQSLIDQMVSDGYSGELEVISNPISLHAFRPAQPGEKEALRRKFNLSGPVIIYAGRLGKEKMVDQVIRAAALLKETFPKFNLVIAGNGPLDNELKKLSRELGIDDNVVFTGFLDHATLAEWYKTADVYANMSVVETQCLTLMQAYATSLPAAGANVEALGQHIKPEFGFTVPEGDYKGLSLSLARLLQNPAEAKAMGERAYLYVENFAEEKVADMWENIYTRYVEQN